MPLDDVAPGVLIPVGHGSFCKWKGEARYFDVLADGRRAGWAAWSYPEASGRFAAMAGHVAFYAALMEACWVGDERASPQPGGCSPKISHHHATLRRSLETIGAAGSSGTRHPNRCGRLSGSRPSGSG